MLFVLVHGAWHGGWCWSRVADMLLDAGHTVTAPTLTGLGERSHLLNRGVDLSMHIRDISAVLEFNDLREVVLVCHSYAGMLLPGIVHASRDRVHHAVCVDGFLPEHGESAMDLLPEHAAAHYRSAAVDQGDGWRVPPRPLDRLGVDDEHAKRWLEGRLVPHPLATYLQPSPRATSEAHVPGTYVLCSGWNTPFIGMADRAAALGWDVHRLPADHEVMATAPTLLAEVLHGIATGRPDTMAREAAI